MDLKIHLGDLIFMSIQFHEILELQNIAFFAIALIYQILIQRPSWKQDQKIDWHNFKDRNCLNNYQKACEVQNVHYFKIYV